VTGSMAAEQRGATDEWQRGRGEQRERAARAGGRRAGGAAGRAGAERRQLVWETKKKQRRRRLPTVFKSLIFGGFCPWPPKIWLFSAAVSGAAENNLIFGGHVKPPKIAAKFRWLGMGRRKLYRPPKMINSPVVVKRGRKSKFAPKAVEGFLLGYDSNTRAYRVFNKSTGLVEVSCDIVFDETNGSQVEQFDLDELDDEEAPCVALRNMSIGDVCLKESKEPTQDQPSSSMQASPPTQDEDQAQDDENEDQEEPPQEEDNDQGGDANDQDKEDDQGPRPPHPRVHEAIQRDHPVNSILGDIHKGVTTRSRVAHFCEHLLFRVFY
jgi:hypothetical protein